VCIWSYLGVIFCFTKYLDNTYYLLISFVLHGKERKGDGIGITWRGKNQSLLFVLCFEIQRTVFLGGFFDFEFRCFGFFFCKGVGL
jgi:hypothetical protein